MSYPTKDNFNNTGADKGNRQSRTCDDTGVNHRDTSVLEPRVPLYTQVNQIIHAQPVNPPIVSSGPFKVENEILQKRSWSESEAPSKEIMCSRHSSERTRGDCSRRSQSTSSHRHSIEKLPLRSKSLPPRSTFKLRNYIRDGRITYHPQLVTSSDPFLRRKCITLHQDILQREQSTCIEKRPPLPFERKIRGGSLKDCGPSFNLVHTFETEISYNRAGARSFDESGLLYDSIVKLPEKHYVLCIEYLEKGTSDTTFFLSESVERDEDFTVCGLRGAQEEAGLTFDPQFCKQLDSTRDICFLEVDIRDTTPFRIENNSAWRPHQHPGRRPFRKSVLFIHGPYEHMKEKIDSITHVAYSSDWNIRALSAISRDTALSIARVNIFPPPVPIKHRHADEDGGPLAKRHHVEKTSN